jgi:hypothetical protein
MRRGAANILLFGAALALAIAAATLLSGGVAWRAVRLSLRDPWRPFLLAVALAAAARVISGGADFRRAVQRYGGTAVALPWRIAALASASVLVFAIAWTSRAAGGSDSSCYVLQAEAFAHGRATLANPVAQALPEMPNAVFAPTGFLPSPRVYGAAVPICAPGLALAMAVAYRVHPGAVFLVVPMAAALLVWLTFLYGRGVDGEFTGACAAVLVACSPILLYQAVQPMSDVPAAAAWVAALVSASPFAAGAWASVAVLLRPNLALLVPLALIARGRGQPPSAAGGPWIRALLFATGAVPGMIVLLALNGARYGSPLASGYGDTGVLFSWTHVTANAPRYARWMLETHTPFVLLALAAPWAFRRDPGRARLAWVSLASVALLAGTYLAYTVFDDWWYIRFLLPAVPILLTLGVAVLSASTGRWRSTSSGRAVIAAICAAISIWYVSVARGRQVLDLQRLEARFAATGDSARLTLPPDAVVLAVQQSGSIRFHGHRDTLAWDAIPADALDRTIDELRRSGRAVYVALEDEEEARFRQRFTGQRNGALDWPPVAEVRAAPHVRIYPVLPPR